MINFWIKRTDGESAIKTDSFTQLTRRRTIKYVHFILCLNFLPVWIGVEYKKTRMKYEIVCMNQLMKLRSCHDFFW